MPKTVKKHENYWTTKRKNENKKMGKKKIKHIKDDDEILYFLYVYCV